MSSNSHPGSAPRLVVPVRLVLVGYWVSMCVATHIPNPPDVVPAQVSDTWLHLTAYLGLAVLLVQGVAVGRRVNRRDAIRLWGLAAVYGALDEVTQLIPVLHRTAEWKDWAADVAGAAVGVLVGMLVARAWAAQGGSGPESAAGASVDPDR